MKTLSTQQIDTVSGSLMMSEGQAQMIGGFVGGMIGGSFGGFGGPIGGFAGAELGDFIYNYGSFSSAAAEESSPLYGLTE